jgi:hypothetical protein
MYFTAIWLLYGVFPPKLAESDIGTGGIFYPTAIRQLFTGIYFMELCLAGLFFLVRDAENKALCTTQGIIMAVAIALTVLFHVLLYGAFSWVRLSGYLKSIQSSSQHESLPETRRGKETAEQITVGLNGLEADQLEDEALQACRPIIWIPKDELGIAADEISHERGAYESTLSCQGTGLDEYGKIRVWGPPPDLQKV